MCSRTFEDSNNLRNLELIARRTRLLLCLAVEKTWGQSGRGRGGKQQIVSGGRRGRCSESDRLRRGAAFGRPGLPRGDPPRESRSLREDLGGRGSTLERS